MFLSAVVISALLSVGLPFPLQCERNFPFLSFFLLIHAGKPDDLAGQSKVVYESIVVFLSHVLISPMTTSLLLLSPPILFILPYLLYLFE